MSSIDDDSSLDEETAKTKESDPKKKKTLVILIVALIIILGGAVGFFVVANKDSGTSGENYNVVEVSASNLDEGSTQSSSEKGKDKKETLVLIDLPEVNVQVGDPLSGIGNLKLSLNIEISKTDDLKRIEALMPKILDTIISHTTELSYDEIKGAKGLYFLREELLFRINIITDPVKVYNLNFKNMELIR
ncbi:MAG: flagellar basal body-associated FliL family protein [Alphaproteobacteria bacterium]